MYYIKMISVRDGSCLHYVSGSLGCPILCITHKRSDALLFPDLGSANDRCALANRVYPNKPEFPIVFKVVKARSSKGRYTL